MKSYLLLRNNQQSGPYTLDALNNLTIYKTDLFWIENESTSWSFSSEIPELKYLKPKNQSINTSISNKDLHQKIKSGSYKVSTPVYENETRELFADESRKRNRSILMASFIGGMVTFLLVVVGVLVSAFAVKNIVNAFQKNNPLATAQATEIHSLTSQSHNSAFSDQLIALDTNTVTRKTLQVDSIHPTTIYIASKKSIDIKSAIPKNNAIDEVLISGDDKKSVGVNTESVAILEMNESKIGETNSNETPKKETDIRSMIKATASDFKVGVLGGISDLVITVTNNSPNIIEKAIVEINYLKPNGNSIKTETLTVKNLNSGGTKSIEIPPTSRGVKVSYRVIEAVGLM